MKSRLAFFGIVFLLSSQLCLAQWVKQNPFPPSGEIHSVIVKPDGTGWMTSGTQNIYKTIDGGQTWNAQILPLGLSVYNKMLFFSENDCIIACNNGYVAISRNAGISWEKTQLSSGTIVDISFSDSLNGLVAFSQGGFKTTDGGYTWHSNGIPYNWYRRLFYVTPEIAFVTDGTQLRRSTDGGVSWSIVSVGSATGILQIKFKDADNGWLTAENNSLFKTTDAGASWVPVALPSGGGVYSLSGIMIMDSVILISGIANGYFRSTDNGNTWSQPSYPVPNVTVFSFSWNSMSTVFAFGSGMAVSTDKGESWRVFKSTNNQHLYSVHFTDEDNGWIAGSNGTILKTTNGGDWWAASQINTNVDLNEIQFFDANTGIVCGNGGNIYFTSDGGANWVAQNSNTTMDLISMYFSDRFYGIVVGKLGTILRTTDGGANWNIVPSNTTKNLNGIHSTGPNNWWITGSQKAMLFSSDNGLQWNSKFVNDDSADYYNIHFFDSMNGWAVGKGYYNINPNIAPNAIAVRTTDGGVSWTTRRAYIEVYYSIFATSPYDVYIGTFQGLVYHSTDGGIDYFYEDLQVGTRPMYDMYFVNPTTGWVVGRDGHIFKTTSGTISTSIHDQPGSTPEDFSLLQNYPNPFNPSTVLTFTLPQSSHVRLDIYDITGRKIQTLVNENLQPGTHTAEFNASAFSSGIYIAKITAGSYFQTVKMTYLK